MSQQTISRYLIYAELDRGGMAIVYRAHDPNFERDVAIKVLPSQFLHDRTFRARFQREAQAVAMLEHAAIVPVYDFGEENGQMYLVMRYMTGGSLAERVAEGPMSLAEVARIVGRLAPALDKAHILGIIHRDLKPANILFDGDGEAYITDFGIARLVETTVELTASNVIVGTPAYMSPEQARDSSDIDGRSDVYSLGVIVFQMLTAQLPYQAHSSIGYLTAHINDPVPDILDYNPTLPPICRMIIQKALAKDAAERYTQANELAADLKMATEAGNIADTLRTPLRETDESTVARGATRRMPMSDSPQAPIVPLQIVRASKPSWLPRQWKIIAAWLAGSMAAIAVACLVLTALDVFNFFPLAAQATNTPGFPAIESHTKVATQITMPLLTPTITPTITPTFMPTTAPATDPPTPTKLPTATRIPPTRMPTATSTVTPSPTSTETPLPGLEHGLTGIKFSLRKTYLAINEAIWYDLSVTNNNSNNLSYGLLGAEVYYSDGGLYFIDQSITNGMLPPGQILTRADSFPISIPGAYGVKLIICYDTLDVCNTPAGHWERLSPLITFIVYAGNTPIPTATP